MAALKEEVKRFIVQALACYDTPTEVAEAVKEEFGLEVTRMQVSTYDPTKKAGEAVGPKWRAVFEATRKAFLENTASIPIAQQSFRLRSLNKIHAQAMKRGNSVVAVQVLEQAAKETGGAFTNRRELTGGQGKDLIPTCGVLAVPSSVAPDDWEAAVQQLHK